MSTSDSTVKGKFDEIAGKTKQGFGELIDDQSTANSGAAQQVKGSGEQALGSVKEAVHDADNTPAATDTRRSMDEDAHDARQSATSTASSMKDHVRNAVDDLKR